MPWFLFPDAQLRPTIINMWGLTGTGKTALVNRIVELLDHKKLYVQMDMGEFESDSASWIKTMFTDDLEFFHQQNGIICFDEFQFARSVSSEGKELGKDKLRVIWEMLDSGKINYIPYQNSYYLIRAELCLMNLQKCGDKGVQIENGIVVEKEKEFLETL
jgi:cell division protease FtsH